MFCYKCGSELREGAKFCSSCGQAMNNNSQQTIRRDFIPNSNNVYQVTNPIRYDQYGRQMYNGGQAPVQNKQESIGIASLVLGIFSIMLCFASFFAMILGGLAIVFGIMQIKKKYSIGLGIAGISTAVVGILLSLVIALFAGAFFSNIFDTNSSYDSGYSYDYNYDYDYDDSDDIQYDDNVKSKNL